MCKSFFRYFTLVCVLLGACSVVVDKVSSTKLEKSKRSDIVDFSSSYNTMVANLQGSPSSYQDSDWQLVGRSFVFFNSKAAAENEQWRYIALRQQRHPIVGYKVALGSERVQQLFGLNEPVIGALFQGDLLRSGAQVRLNSAKNLAFEPDLLARVKSADINSATTIAEVAAQIDQISAFIELPDLMVPIASDHANAFIATNAAVRWGVIGDTLVASEDDDFIQRLGSMTVDARDEEGTLLSTAPGHALMGHPYQALLFLIQKLQRRDILLQRGDVISLGAYAAPKKATGYEGVSVEYRGLDPNRTLRAEVSFH